MSEACLDSQCLLDVYIDEPETYAVTLWRYVWIQNKIRLGPSVRGPTTRFGVMSPFLACSYSEVLSCRQWKMYQNCWQMLARDENVTVIAMRPTSVIRISGALR